MRQAHKQLADANLELSRQQAQLQQAQQQQVQVQTELLHVQQCFEAQKGKLQQVHASDLAIPQIAKPSSEDN